MGILLRFAVLTIGVMTFAIGFLTTGDGRTGKVSESVPLAIVDQTEKLASAAYMIAGAILLAGSVLAFQFDTARTPKP